MKGLIYKDIMTELLAFRRMKFLALLCVIALPVIVSLAEDDLTHIHRMPLLMCMVMGMMMINTCLSYDEQSGWMGFALTNPVSRTQYYHAKLLTHGINVCAGGLLGLVISILLTAVTGILTAGLLGEILVTFVLQFLCFFLIGIINVPLAIKFGAQRSYTFMMLFLAILGGIIAALFFARNQDLQLILPIEAVLLIGAFSTMYLLGRKWIKEKEL
ncbi:MAG: ABC-2 transporter permease [Ruminococcus sp.]|nr:ABC-2 transporter permease [Ruminococcus sp.]